MLPDGESKIAHFISHVIAVGRLEAFRVHKQNVRRLDVTMEVTSKLAVGKEI